MTKKTLEHKVVKIPEEGRFKFVLIEHKEGLKLRGDFLSMHRDIVWKAQKEEGLEGYVAGGGRIEVDPGRKTIYAYGVSGDYGEADQDLVEQLLKPYAEGFGYELLVEMGKGY